MPKTCTTSWSLFTPQRNEVQFDEKWSFVGKKEKHCDPAHPSDNEYGDNWDHAAFDAEHRLVVSVLPGKRSAEHIEELVKDLKKRTGGRMMNLFVSDEFAPYKTAILNAYKVPPEDLKYATVHKTREKGRVVNVDLRIVFGKEEEVKEALEASGSKQYNQHGSYLSGRMALAVTGMLGRFSKTYCFSKDWDVHNAVTDFTMYSYNFCWPVRTLRERDSEGRWHPRTPAMVAGLSDHVWSMADWLTFPAIQLR